MDVIGKPYLLLGYEPVRIMLLVQVSP
jgi:hypothetical protein